MKFPLCWIGNSKRQPARHPEQVGSWSAISRKRHPDLIKNQVSTTDCGSCPPFHDCIHPRGNISGEPADGQATGALLLKARPGRSNAAKRSSRGVLYEPGLKQLF